jgi:hypothetical protein
VTVTYTPFDLPKVIKQGALTKASFGYDGDEQRIRKTTPVEETIYFDELYERVTAKMPATTAHRYYVHSPERVVAVVTRGGPQPGTRRNSGKNSFVAGDFSSEGRFIRAWYVTNGYDLLLVTYVSQEPQSQQVANELHEAAAIIASLDFK